MEIPPLFGGFILNGLVSNPNPVLISISMYEKLIDKFLYVYIEDELQ
jgi:hypothetical protein